MASLEHTTLGKCVSKLQLALQSDINGIVSYLFSEGFLTDDLFEEILNPRSFLTDANKATKLVTVVMRRVKLEPSNYYNFVNYLRQDKRKYKDIVNILDAEYFGIRLTPEQTGMLIARHQHEQSCPINGKHWHKMFRWHTNIFRMFR